MNRLQGWIAGRREVSVAGLGRSGAAAARLLLRHGVPVYLSDSATSASLAEAASALRAEFPGGLTVDTGGHDLDRIAASAGLVLSPGIPPESKVVRGAERAGVPVVSELQLALDAMPDTPCIAVTGTNGKSTVTSLVQHLLAADGLAAVAAGNIGNPLSAVALSGAAVDWVALEVSSFQLHDTPDLVPAVGILTNLAPDHLDRYSSLAAYYDDKARLFANARHASLWVSNLDDDDSRKMVHGVPGRHLAFTTREGARADAWYDRAQDLLMMAGHPLLERRRLHLLGDHNVANALAAALAVHAVGVDRAAIARGLDSFRALHHRLEPVREVEGILWINDSKATNVASTRVALEAMTRPYVLLLGGRHKGEPYTSLIEPFRPFGVAVVAYGESAERVEHDLAGSVSVVRGGTFEDVVSRARALVPSGGAVLLSPACSSYDMFRNYEERGARFRQLVEAM